MRESVASVKKRGEVFTALRHRNFRLFWFGHLIAVSGQQAVFLAEGWLIYYLTESPLVLGMLGLAEAIPGIALTLFGGAVADKVDMRRLLVVTQTVAAVAFFVLATLTGLEMVRVWHVFAVAFVFGVAWAFDQPARQALFPHLIDRRDMVSAVSLNSTIWPASGIFGPAVAGIIIDRVGVLAGSPLVGAAAAFYLASVSFVIFGLFLLVLKVPPMERARGRNVMRDIAQGLSFVWNQRLFAFLIGMSFMNSFFATSYMTLMPVFASDVFHGGASTLGFLYTASSVGRLVGAFVAASLARFSRRGWLIIGGAAAQALFLMLFATTTSFGAALLPLILAGVGVSLFAVSSQSTLQLLVPDQFRGRVMGVWGMTHNVVMPLGRMQMGAVASVSRASLAGPLGRLAGAPAAVILGGVIMLTFTLLGAGSYRPVRDLSAQELSGRQEAPSSETPPSAPKLIR